MNPEAAGAINGFWMPVVVFKKETGVTRGKLQQAFAEVNIDARTFSWLLSSSQMFEGMPENCIARDIPKNLINLLSYHDMTSDDLSRV